MPSPPAVDTELQETIRDAARRARAASRALRRLDAGDRRRLVEAMADGVAAASSRVLAANTADLEAARAGGLSAPLLDRLLLDHARFDAMVEGVRHIAALPDPVGETLDVLRRPNGLVIRRVCVPLGVVAVIYESRPNVTADAAALCLKAGNAVILKGGSEALATNRAIRDAMVEGAAAADPPPDTVQLLTTTDRRAVHELVRMEGWVDLVIPRGGEGLVRAVVEHATVPVLKHAKGVCHVYVDAAADPEMALAIIENAKCQRPGVCNAVETVLVHERLADTFLPALADRLEARGVRLRADERARRIIPGADAAGEDDWSAEYLDLVLAIAVVPSLDAAIDHVERHGSHHSDVIVTADDAAAARFTTEVDSAAVYVNASSRFTDGSEFGMGAEIGISTDKLHARGPCGIKELTTYKYVIEGTGQIRP